jgi:hypothetical protein
VPAAALPELAKRLVDAAVTRKPLATGWAALLLLLLLPRAVEGISPMYAVRKDCVAEVWLCRLLVSITPEGAL